MYVTYIGGYFQVLVSFKLQNQYSQNTISYYTYVCENWLLVWQT